MDYAKPTPDDVSRLRAIVGDSRCLTGDMIGPDYAHDELGGVERMPDVVAQVRTTGEVSAIMRLAGERRIPVVVRGAGTGLVGGAVAVEGGIVIDTSLMKEIVELDENNLTVTVQPGVLLMELVEFVESRGFFYPPDPGEKSATIGGNISTNAGGMRAVKYGVTRDYVRGLTVVLPDGEALTLGGKVVKNCSGYSLKDLLVGSEGILAVVTEAVLRLLPLSACSVGVLVPFPSMESVLEAVPGIIRSKATPTAIEYMSRETIEFAEKHLNRKFPDAQHSAYILMSFDGVDEEQVEREYTAVAGFCLEHGVVDAFVIDTEERKKLVWNTRGAFLEAIKASTTLMDECDVVVPRDRVADFIKFTHSLAAELHLRLPSFGHAGDGNLHVYLCRDELDENEWQRRMRAAFDAMYRTATDMGGQISGEHGIGFAKREYLRRHCSPAHMELMRRIKFSFDPHCILNPRKVCI